ncbi:ABC transporter substrate-binding protein [Corynebacterium sp. A21]|uniref:ABC transporter substrate-binding protein n=1 Tax=Corynebacterium sp. A21 TaxID=3457318 RepID=UPI003FD5107E
MSTRTHRLGGSLVAVFSIIALTACNAGSTATSIGRISGPDTIVVGTTSAPASLDFTTTGGAAIPQALMSNVYEGLVRINSTGEIEPWLASSWTVSEDGREYTFQLRENVHFSNGDEFNAETAKFSIDHVKNGWSNGLSAQMEVVAGAEVLGTHLLKVILAEPSNNWLWSMGTLIGAMMTPSGLATLADDPVGTGPYRVAHWAVGESITFQANPSYWGTQPESETAAIRYFSDATATTNALQSGDVDVVWAMSAPELLDNLPEKYRVEVGTTNGELLLSMNNQAAPFDDPRVRQAVMYGVDRQAIIDLVYEGHGTDTGGAPVPPTDPWFTGENFYPHDPARARELLAEAGIDGSNNKLSISVPSLPYAEATAEVLYSQLRDIGFDVTLRSTEFPAVWLAEVMGDRNYQMSLIAHVEARDIPVLFGNPDYYLGFDSAQVRDSLAAAASGPLAAQRSHMRAAVAVIMAEAGADTLLNVPNIVLSAPGVTGVEPDVVTDALPLAGISKQEE